VLEPAVLGTYRLVEHHGPVLVLQIGLGQLDVRIETGFFYVYVPAIFDEIAVVADLVPGPSLGVLEPVVMARRNAAWDESVLRLQFELGPVLFEVAAHHMRFCGGMSQSVDSEAGLVLGLAGASLKAVVSHVMVPGFDLPPNLAAGASLLNVEEGRYGVLLELGSVLVFGVVSGFLWWSLGGGIVVVGHRPTSSFATAVRVPSIREFGRDRKEAALYPGLD
jgi:hypothetical protein